MANVSGKIKRQFMAHLINSALPGDTQVWNRLGKDLEEYVIEMNANVETKNNILGETSVNLDSYQPQASVEPYYAEIGDPMFDRLQEIIDDRQTLDELRTETLEVHLWEEPSDGVFVAYKEDAVVEVVSYGGDTTGYQIPFNLHHTGNRVKGTYDTGTKKFTEAA